MKRSGASDTQYHLIEHVDPQQLVAQLLARWASERIPPLDPSQLLFRVLRRGPGKPTPHDETSAETLSDPRLSLLAARLENESSLEVCVVDASGAPPRDAARCLRAERRPRQNLLLSAHALS